MPNFFTDNEDIQFRFNTMDLGSLADIMEEGFKFAKEFDHAPAGKAEAVQNYRMVLDALGGLSGNFIAPRAEDVDTTGPVLQENGRVAYAQGTAEALDMLAKGEVMGFTLPHRFGGLNFPNLIYTMAIEMVSRADAGLMNIFGLQGIAETINAFASEEIKQEYLPDMAAGKTTGAMVLTEPDAGSDLQSVKLRAYQDDSGQWRLNGVKRFITNGCGEILLVLARSEPEISDGRGLSLFLAVRNETIKVRRIERKLGIHGSPTCELQFNDCPCQLIGERQRGLITYVMALMNGARVGIAGQSIGIGEAAYRVARNYAAKRKQFDTAIENFPSLRDLLIESRLDLLAARLLTYETCRVVDILYGASRRMEYDRPTDKDELKTLREKERKFKKLAGMLTPMSKYYASEMAMKVSNDAIAVLGGSGYMKDYPVERYMRDARITTIYEGTSQLQVIAAVRGVVQGAAEQTCQELAAELVDAPESVKPLVEKLNATLPVLAEVIGFVKAQPGVEYMDLYGRKIVDAAIDLMVGYWFCRDVKFDANRAPIARRWVNTRLIKIKMLREMILSGDRSSIEDFAALAGPVPTEV
ncbi:MAG: acyl-CoA dehydrogenase family protein [Phycisphaerae bacterium]|nr:acyl-CoA dehydrogenase family protein [Phycisphaerae bacterium]